MDVKHITPDYAVSEQLDPADVQTVILPMAGQQPEPAFPNGSNAKQTVAALVPIHDSSQCANLMSRRRPGFATVLDQQDAER